MHLKKGFRLNNGKYEILDLLGQGGFGITYKAEGKTSLHGELGSIEVTAHVAIKEFFFKDYCERERDTMRVTFSSATGKELFQRFKEKLVKEAIILSKLNHTNIIRVIEIFEENNTAYMVMEFVERNSLLDILNERETIPVSQAIDYISQIGDALSYVHTQNILHLDVKPSNILLRKKDDRALLIDFGVSKRYSPEHKETSITPVGRSKGYAPLEQYSEKGTATFAPSLDVYSLGATLYHCITGIIPPEPHEIVENGLTPPSEINPLIPGNLEKAIMKAMALKKADRFQTVEEFIQALKDTGKSKQEPEPIKLSVATISESVYSGETLPGDKYLADKLPESAARPESPDIKQSEVLYAGETRLDIEKPVSSASGKESEILPEKSPQGYLGETEHDNDPPLSSPLEPPTKPGHTAKKTDSRYPWLGWIIAAAVIVGFALTLVWWYNRGPSAKEIEEKRIADSIKVADSLAMIQAEQQRLADSIVNSKSGTFTDLRDNQTYKWIRIGDQVWMAQNLNFETNEGSFYNPNNPKKEYGRLYSYHAAFKACPDGWRLPTYQDWRILIDNAGGKENAFDNLRSYEWKWGKESPERINKIGFSALAAGIWSKIGGSDFYYRGYEAEFWGYDSCVFRMGGTDGRKNVYLVEKIGEHCYYCKWFYLSLRCIKTSN